MAVASYTGISLVLPLILTATSLWQYLSLIVSENGARNCPPYFTFLFDQAVPVEEVVIRHCVVKEEGGNFGPSSLLESDSADNVTLSLI